MSYDVPRGMRQILAEETHVAYIKLVADLSDRFKLLTLKVKNHETFSFLPGQWVNVIAPIYNKPTQSMITTTPKLFKDREGILDVAVFRSLSIASEFIYKRSFLEDPLLLKVEGTHFVFEYPLEDSTPWPDLLLIAGGLGILSVISILRHCMEWNRSAVSQNSAPRCNVSLLYSADAADSFLFREEIQGFILAQEDLLYKYFRVEYFLTGLKIYSPPTKVDKQTWRRRICPDDVIRNLTEYFNLENTRCYMSGPVLMMDDLYHSLAKRLTSQRVFYEDWQNLPSMRESTLCL